MYKTKFRFTGDKGTWPISWDATLNQLTACKKVRILEAINDNEKLLLEIWSKAPKSTIHGPWPFTNWKIQVVETIGIKEDWPWWLNFSNISPKYSWYSSSKDLDSTF